MSVISGHITTWYGEDLFTGATGEEARQAQVEGVVEMVREEEDSGEVDLVVFGADLNDVRDSAAVGILKKAGLVDIVGEEEAVEEEATTWGRRSNTWTGDGREGRYRIDYVMMKGVGGREFSIHSARVVDMKTQAGAGEGGQISLSDHAGIVVDIGLK